MTHANINATPSAATLPRPRHYLGNQPVVAVARYQSEQGCDWSMLYHVVSDICEPFSGNDFQAVDLSDVDCSGWPLYDYDCEQINRWFLEELEIDDGFEIEWANMCGMHRTDAAPLHVLLGQDTVVDENDCPIDCYWEVSVLSRDDADFWKYLLSDTPASINIHWEPRQEAFSKLVLDWVLENPDSAERWLTASPTPQELVGESKDLDTLITKIKRAIRQGRID